MVINKFFDCRVARRDECGSSEDVSELDVDYFWGTEQPCQVPSHTRIRCASFCQDIKLKKSVRLKCFRILLYPNEYNLIMYFIEKTVEFDKWIRKLNDLRAKAKILFRLQKLEKEEHFGNCEPVGDGIRELKINYAKGYRVYFKEIEGKIIILLVGGDKSTQQKDIVKAKGILKKLKK